MLNLAVHRGSAQILLLSKYLSGNEIKEDEMGCVCGMYGEEQKCIQYFGEDLCKKDTTCQTGEHYWPFKDEAQTAVFKDPFLTAL